MFIILLGSIIAFAMVNEVAIVPDRKPGDTVVRVAVQEHYQYDTVVNVEPLVVQKFRNVVRQQYDYSCGSAALTTLLDFYLGRNFQERQVMEGLLRFGETERIVQRRGFSLLDMKRLVTALGHPSGGFKAEAKDLVALDHPAIAPIEYAGFKHFVVIRSVHEGRVYVADPALGNLSFTLSRFLEIWDNNVLFIVFPNGHKPANGLELREEDMRFVADYLIAENSFREFPLLAMSYEDKIANAVAELNNNARSSYSPRLDAGGNYVKNADGQIVYDIELGKAEDGINPEDFNVRAATDPTERLEKELRFRRK